MKKVASTLITLTAIGVAMRVASNLDQVQKKNEPSVSLYFNSQQFQNLLQELDRKTQIQSVNI